MARAELKEEIIRKPLSVELTLFLEEAVALKTMLDFVGGDRYYSVRKYLAPVSSALAAAGIKSTGEYVVEGGVGLNFIDGSEVAINEAVRDMGA